ncbi:hypothetical protein [Dactylosporangium darangshiense]|uniref:Uncharacterized protein n=1 Tax=Dactylosporangium darangshiense TaxID=579108 RepID=A0ABP8DMX9_9ACTN
MATYADWDELYELAYETPGDLSGLACPNCGHHALHLVYTGDLDQMIGWGTFYCDNCRQGIGISRAVVPEGAILRDRHLPPEQRQPRTPGDVQLVPPQ